MAEAGYRQLVVWQKAMDLAELVYQVCRNLPDTEKYGLASQMQRAVVAIPSNVAEGYGRGGRDYARFVRIARGSLMELETQMELAVRIGHLNRDDVIPCWNTSQEVGRMLTKLAQSLDANRR